MDSVKVSLNVNGKHYEREVSSRMLLSDFLREELELKGTHVGCEHGVCGMCTVLVNGASVRSCLMFAVQATGADVQTVEGLADGDKLHPLQQAFQEKHGLQCGYCSPAMLMVSKELLDRNKNPSVDEIRESISSNLCRCTGYETIVESVQLAAEMLNGSKS